MWKAVAPVLTDPPWFCDIDVAIVVMSYAGDTVAWRHTHMFIQTHNLRTRETVSVELPSTQSLMRLMVFVVLCFCVPLQSGEQTNTSVRNSYMFVDQSVLNFVHICFKACSRINSASLHKQPSINLAVYAKMEIVWFLFFFQRTISWPPVII